MADYSELANTVDGSGDKGTSTRQTEYEQNSEETEKSPPVPA